ncbi:ribbon-helix-helix protein, CopG family [Hassallia byssoidea VB512170]|uniref:Ribbon-helix-helix protein, CopG family n=2 Tax=Hassallia TaxID=482629 RepID=A0A846HIV2_9CYAN|nr:ribbon-helix-helix protein, CopG family [Hassalia byssoidea VB512170]
MRKPLHGQRKQKLTLTISPEGVELLEAQAKMLGISKSEILERVARNQVSSPSEQQMMGEYLTI